MDIFISLSSVEALFHFLRCLLNHDLLFFLFWDCFLKKKKKSFVILLLYVKTRPSPFTLCCCLGQTCPSCWHFGLGTVEGSLAMPADSCSIIQCPGIILIIHLDTGCVLQKINKTCFENVPSFFLIFPMCIIFYCCWTEVI